MSSGAYRTICGVGGGPIFVRHGKARVVNDVPTAAWPLDPNFVHDVSALAERLADRRVVVSIDFRRALETATLFGQPLRDPRLREVERQWTSDLDVLIRRYFAGESIRGWESQTDVVARVSAVVDEFGDDALYVGHGTSLTLYFKDRFPGLDAYGFWAQLRNPDAWLIQRDSLIRL